MIRATDECTRPYDFGQHNEAIREIWQSYRDRRPTRVPMILGTNPRYTMFGHPANPRSITFQQYFGDPMVMVERQLEHQRWVRLNLPQDAEMGPNMTGWHVCVDFQNCYEAAWFGCEVRYYDHQVPDTAPGMVDEYSKRNLVDQGPPDPFGGWMARNWEFYDRLVVLKESGWEWDGVPILSVSPSGLGTDGPLTTACNLRGAQNFLADLLEDRSYAEELLSFITEATILRIAAYRERLGQPAKSHGWGFADDSLQLISGPMMEEVMYPHYRRLLDALSDGGPNSIHLCGNATRHFPSLRDNLGVRSFDTGFPVDFGSLREAVGDDVEILGGPSVPFLMTASPEEVSSETARILGSGIMRGGRFVLREGNNLAPGVPVANLWAMYNAVNEFGRYDSPVSP